MSAQIINGKKISRQIRCGLKSRVEALAGRGVVPALAVVMVGENPASRVYVTNKVLACGEVGIRSREIHLPGDIAEQELLRQIVELNRDPAIHGLLVQLPLPGHIDPHRVFEAVAVEKDVDGFHLYNVGALTVGSSLFAPCTPSGVMRLLEHEGVAVRGQHAVVVGSSNIVGKPMALMLLQEGATVTVCNSKTRDLSRHVRLADILIVAVGKPGTITGDMVKPGAVVMDVGINRLPGGRLVGDVDYASVAPVASRITPVPGGVGPMTVAMLLENTLIAAERQARPRSPTPVVDPVSV